MDKCTLCGQETDSLAHLAEQTLIKFIKDRNPDWVESDGACRKCIEYYNDMGNVVVLNTKGVDEN